LGLTRATAQPMICAARQNPASRSLADARLSTEVDLEVTASEKASPRWGRRILWSLFALVVLIGVATRIALQSLADRVEQTLIREVEDAFQLEVENEGMDWSLLSRRFWLEDVSLHRRFALHTGSKADERALVHCERVGVQLAVDWNGGSAPSLNMAVEADGVRLLMTRDRDGVSNWQELGSSEGEAVAPVDAEEPAGSGDGESDEGESDEGESDEGKSGWQQKIVGLALRDAEFLFALEFFPETEPLRLHISEVTLHG
jgi:hypothetical protein